MVTKAGTKSSARRTMNIWTSMPRPRAAIATASPCRAAICGSAEVVTSSRRSATLERFGTNALRSSKQLRDERIVQKLCPRDIAPRPGEAGDESCGYKILVGAIDYDGDSFRFQLKDFCQACARHEQYVDLETY